MSNAPTTHEPGVPKKQRPFRRAVLRGLAIVMPPLLTVVVFLWAWSIVESSVLLPMERATHTVIRWITSDVADMVPPDVTTRPYKAPDGRTVESFAHEGKEYVRIGDGQWVAKAHYDELVTGKRKSEVIPTDADRFYERYAQLKCPRRLSLPVLLLVFVGILFLCGKLMAFGVGRVLWNATERAVVRVPIIRNVYSSVKQVTDLFFGEHSERQFTRVVAVEYPRKGIWALAFVTGESFVDLRGAAGEPVVALLVPTSPMPAAGFTITVRKSETIDLNITIDQAIQFIVSCGVVSPAYAWTDNRLGVAARITETVARHLADPAHGSPSAPGVDAAVPK